MKILLLLLLLPFSLMASNDPAVKILSDSGLIHSVAKVKTIYANSGDHIFYKETSASNGMLLLTDDGVVKFSAGTGNKVVGTVGGLLSGKRRFIRHDACVLLEASNLIDEFKTSLQVTLSFSVLSYIVVHLQIGDSVGIN